MAYISCTLKSALLRRSVEVQLYFPSDLPSPLGYDTKGVLTLLHGYSNNGKDWMQMSAAPRYAADNGLVLIAPSCENSFYHNTPYGDAWKTFVTEEMPLLLGRIFRLPAEREKNFIAGLSMGGYGALYLGLSRPDLYAGCASFSGAVDLGMMLREADKDALQPFIPVLGEALTLAPDDDIYELSRRASLLPAQEQPAVLMTNGLEDIPIYGIKAQNDAMHAHMQTLGLARYRRMEWHGVHEWNFWDRSLVYAIDYFLQNGYAEKKHADWRYAP